LILQTFSKRLSEDFHFKELIQGSLTFFILRILGLIVGYAFTLIVTRNLGASCWGIFALCFTVLQITSVIGKLGLDTALLRFIAQYNAQGKVRTARYIYLKSIIVTIFLSLFLCVLLYYLSPLLAEKVFAKKHLASYLRLVPFALLPFVLLSINSESLRGFKKIKEYTILKNLIPSLFTLMFFSISFYLLNIRNTKAVIITYILGVSVSSLFSFLLLNKEFNNKNGELEKISLRQILSVSLPMLLSSSLFMVMSWTDTIMLGMWRTEEEVGIYNVAVQLSMITSFTLGAINSIAAPKFAEFWGKKDLEGLKKIAQQSTKLIFWTSAPILILYILFPKFFMGIFGKELKEGALALVFLTIGQFVNVMTGPIYYIFQMSNHEKLQFVLQFSYSLFNLLLNIFLIPKYGIYGAAFSLMLTYTIGKLTSSIFLKLKFGFWNIYLVKHF